MGELGAMERADRRVEYGAYMSTLVVRTWCWVRMGMMGWGWACFSPAIYHCQMVQSRWCHCWICKVSLGKVFEVLKCLGTSLCFCIDVISKCIYRSIDVMWVMCSTESEMAAIQSVLALESYEWIRLNQMASTLLIIGRSAERLRREAWCQYILLVLNPDDLI